MEYTKGEWKADNGDSECWGVFTDMDDDGVCYMCEPNGKLLRSFDEAKANANLIAAAPIMHGQLATGIESLEEVREIVVEAAKTCSPEIAEQMVAIQSYISGVIAGNEIALAKAEDK